VTDSVVVSEPCCQVDKLEEGKCKIGLPSPPRTVISGDKYRDNHGWPTKICDGAVFWFAAPASLSLAVVELKGGHVPRSSVGQLQSGADMASSLTETLVKHFAALLVTRRDLHPEDRKVVFRNRIKFRGKSYPAQVIHCSRRIEDSEPWRSLRQQGTRRK
jgi:hypothetical protein